MKFYKIKNRISNNEKLLGNYNSLVDAVSDATKYLDANDGNPFDYIFYEDDVGISLVWACEAVTSGHNFSEMVNAINQLRTDIYGEN